jgi:hypothetical protein
MWFCIFIISYNYVLTSIVSISAFLESIKGIGTFVGGRSLEEYILPLMMQALTGKQLAFIDFAYLLADLTILYCQTLKSLLS